MDSKALKDLEAELHSIAIRVKLIPHVNGIDVVGFKYSDRLIACSELRKHGVPEAKIFHYDVPMPRLCRK
jgi:hypothetical protein